ncbi:MAG: hypothetical protein KAX31_06055 [Thermoplasmata archaeon]|nr:hypothetical protein [Thermoplasmata archaeon]
MGCKSYFVPDAKETPWMAKCVSETPSSPAFRQAIPVVSEFIDGCQKPEKDSSRIAAPNSKWSI